MLDIIQKGGVLMIPLLLFSILAVGVFLERMLYYHRSSINLSELLHGLSNLLTKKNYTEALREVAGTPGPIARVIHTALIHRTAKRTDLKEIVQESAQLEVPRLEKRLPMLLTITHLAPIIGILGTVIGMSEIFIHINIVSGHTSTPELSEGIFKALITSATGLAIAIPSYLFYSFLVSQSKKIIDDMKCAGIESINLIYNHPEEEQIIEFTKHKGKEAQ